MLKRRIFFYTCILLILTSFFKVQGAEIKPEFKLSYLEDKTGNLELKDVLKDKFKPITTHSPNFGLTKSSFWIKIQIENRTKKTHFLLKVHNGTLTSTSLYFDGERGIELQSITDSSSLNQRRYFSQYPIFDINVRSDSTVIYYMKVKTINVMDLPITVMDSISTLNALSLDQLYFGVYFGIILIMFLYNTFIFLSVKDKSYLFYVLYTLIIGVTQASLKGFTSKFLWPDNTWLIHQSYNVFIALSGIFSLLFVFNFLQVKTYSIKLFNALLITCIIYLTGLILSLSGHYVLAQRLLQFNAGLVAILILFTGFYILRQGYKPALFFNISWFFFLSGALIYILKDAGILPYNNFTSNSILIGSGLEAALLSFALADRINSYKKEKDLSQAEALRIAQENEQIIREQNILLEIRVNERTLELKESNDALGKTLGELKEAQSQLVESEKMSSLGQLTAGIAHEINNPINFVTSNVTPLTRDVNLLLDTISNIENVGLSDHPLPEKKKQIEEYKEEIDFDYLKIEINHLLKGIHEGASRTAEIVKGLRIFSRLDEDDLKKADVNEGLESTLVITNNLLDNKIKVIKEYGNLPLIDCFPGKLNQVFLNIISNAIYAIKKKHVTEHNGELKIATWHDEKSVFIKIADNGTGMDENTKHKIFEPFFTTKEVGEGTGLGMSITYNTIKKHNGEIYVNSSVGIGTEFILELPIIHTLEGIN